MNKDALVIVLASFISFIGVNGIVLFFVNEYLKQFQEPEVTTELVDSDTLKVINDSIPNLVQSQKKAKEVKDMIAKLIDDVHNIENADYIAHVKLDSVKTKLLSKIDELIKKDKKYAEKIKDLESSIADEQNTTSSKEKKIAALEKQIEDLKAKNTEIIANKLNTEKEGNYTYLAQTYNTMNPTKVAELLLALDNQTVIEILKRMNQRKTGKVLAALPAYRSAMISKAIVK